MEIRDMPITLLKSKANFLLFVSVPKNFIRTRITITPRSKATGRKKYKNSLKSVFDGAKAFISKSSTKQSNEKNVSVGELTPSTLENIFEKPLGMSMLKEVAAEIKWM